MKIKIGCVWFTPHGWDVCSASIRRNMGYYAMTDLDELICNLCLAGF